MVRKQPGKLFEDENIYNESLSRGKNIYFGKKEKTNLIIPIEKKQQKKKQKTSNWLAKRKKNTVRATMLQSKKCSILSRAK